MKKKNLWLGILVMTLVFGLVAVGCGATDSALNGTWVSREDGMELKFNNGSFEIPENVKGTYSTSDGKMTIQLTHVYGNNDIYPGFGNLLDRLALDKSKWYSKSDLRKKLGIDDLETIRYLPQSWIYSVNGNKLTFTYDDGKTQTFTKK
jgi:hypothetical protein